MSIYSSLRPVLLTQSVLVLTRSAGQCAHLCHHGICNEGHVFVLPRCVKGTTNVYESIRCREYIEDWSVASALTSVSHEASPYFLVQRGQDPHGLLLQTIIGRRQNFGGPSGPSGQNSIFPMRAIERDAGISTLLSHQYSLTDEWVAEEIKALCRSTPQQSSQALCRSTPQQSPQERAS